MLQLQERGLVLKGLANGSFRMGHYLSDPGSFGLVSPALSKQLQGETIPTLAQQVASLQSPTGRQLVKLTQTLDTGDTTQLGQLLVGWQRSSGTSALGGSLSEQVAHWQTRLRGQLNGLAVDQSTGVQPAEASLKTTNSKTTNSENSFAPKPSQLGQRLATLLEKSPLLAPDRCHLATQMGMVWQRSLSGSLRLKEGQGLAQAGSVYTLTRSQQALFSKPSTDDPSTLKLSRGNRAFLQEYLTGQFLPSLLPQQVAGLTLPLLQKVLPAARIDEFQRWYNNQRGNQILIDTKESFGPQPEARRYLSSLYQRGFLVEQSVEGTGKPPTYKMGHYTSVPATYATVPTEVAKVFVQQFPTSAKGQAYLLEGAWPPPESAAAHRMRALARSIDKGESGEPME